MGIAAGMAGFVQEARIIHPAGLPIERGIGGARDRHRRLDAARGVDAAPARPAEGRRRQPSPTKRRAVRSPGRCASARRSCRPRTAPGSPPETASGPEGSRKVEPAAARSGRRSEGPPRRRNRQGRSAPPGRRARRGRRDRDGRRGRLRGGPWRERQGWLLGRPDLAEQADLRVHAWLGQSILLGRARGFVPKARLI